MVSTDVYEPIDCTYAREFQIRMGTNYAVNTPLGGRVPCTVSNNKVDFKYAGLECRLTVRKWGDSDLILTLETRRSGEEEGRLKEAIMGMDARSGEGYLSDNFVNRAIREVIQAGIREFAKQPKS
jgi:hypothetical protein